MPLETTKEALLRVLSYHQVMPAFLDSLFVYGSESGKREVRFSSFRTESSLVNPERPMSSLGRGDRRYQLCYNIKSVSHYINTDDLETMVMRQATIHHQFDVVHVKQLWIVGDPHAELKGEIADKYNINDNQFRHFENLTQSFITSLGVHIVYIRWAVREWRACLQALDAQVDKLTIGPASVATMNTVTALHYHEEKLNEVLAALESNTTTISALLSFYTDVIPLLVGQHGGTAALEKGGERFKLDLKEHVRETQMQCSHINVLLKLLTDRKVTIIERLQAQATAAQNEAARRQEELSVKQLDLGTQQGALSVRQEELAQRQEALNKSMWEQTMQSAQETVAMRIITVITLIYLPPTFVSTFFSTDVVKYQAGESYSALAHERWWSVTGPLMGITFTAAGIWMFLEWKWKKRQLERIKAQYPFLRS